MRVGWIAAFLLLVLLSCSDPEEPRIDVKITRSAWAGGTITLYNLPESTAPRRVFGGSVELATVVESDDAIVVQLPDSIVGDIPVRIGSSLSPVLGHVQVAGIAGYGTLPTDFSPELPEPYVWPRGGVASVLSANPAGQIFRFLPATGALQYLLTDRYEWNRHGVRMPAPTSDPTILGFHRFAAGDTVEFWRLVPEPQLVETLSGFLYQRQLALYGNRIVLRTSSHTISTFPASASSLIVTLRYEDANRILLSPDGTRAVVPVGGSEGQVGVPVFGSEGQLLYNVVGVQASLGAAFSASGDTLYVVGTRGRNVPATPNGRKIYLLVVDAVSGNELKRIDMGGNIPVDVATEPGGKWLFVTTHQGLEGVPAGTELSRLSSLWVFNAQTLEMVGQVRMGPWDCPVECTPRVVAGTDGIFIFAGRQVARVSQP